VTDARPLDPHPYLVGAGLVELDGHHREGIVEPGEHGDGDLHVPTSWSGRRRKDERLPIDPVVGRRVQGPGVGPAPA